MTTVEELLASWKEEPTIFENIAYWQKESAQSATLIDFPSSLHPILVASLKEQGIKNLYLHQWQAWQAIAEGKNVVVSTGTASGKTLCYNLPIIDGWLKYPDSTALFIFPTKALAQDQKQSLARLVQIVTKHSNGISNLKKIAVYDGDTPTHFRSGIRSQVQFLMTNPDMLHMAILPHHTLWQSFLTNLRYVVIDEIHTYRGVFGSHVANVLKRLTRVCKFYGADPQFILTSATIANPVELSERLIDEQVFPVDQDGSPHGSRNFLIYNPPVVNQELGLRRSILVEGVRLATDLLAYQVQSILFARSRRSVELILKELQEKTTQSNQVHGYRSGYLPEERRLIEDSLRRGESRAVVATNALELGIDIGSVNAIILVGYPGTIAATRQQAGRAGRRTGSSLAVLITSSGPLDQFLTRHPEYLFDRSPEQALINPNHILILLQHLRCAAFELPFHKEEGFGTVPNELFLELLAYLEQSGVIHNSADRFYWMADKYPADEVSLRSISAQPVLLEVFNNRDHPTLIGEVDNESATWMVHPQAIYLHEARMYQVEELNLEDNVARLVPVQTDYFTEPQTRISIEKLTLVDQLPVAGGNKYYGEILVTSQVIGFRRIQWVTRQVLGIYPLDMPVTQLRTTAYWISLDQMHVQSLADKGLWRNEPNHYGPNWNLQRNLARKRDQYTCMMCGEPEKGHAHHVHHKIPFRSFPSYLEANSLNNLVTLCPACHQKVEVNVRVRSGLAGLGYVLHQIAPLFLMCDVSDLGVHTDPQSPLSDGQPTVVIYDQIAAGIGLSEVIFSRHAELMEQALDLVTQCPCRDGCPSCVGPAGENGLGGKLETLAILSIFSGNDMQKE